MRLCLTTKFVSTVFNNVKMFIEKYHYLLKSLGSRVYYQGWEWTVLKKAQNENNKPSKKAENGNFPPYHHAEQTFWKLKEMVVKAEFR